MDPVDVRPISLDEIDVTALVVARGMADNPHHLRDFGTKPVPRVVLGEKFYATVLSLIGSRGVVLAAYRDGAIVGGLGAMAPSQCHPSVGVQARLAANFLARLGFRHGLRTIKWMKARMAYDPREPHWHLGPVAVDPASQGQGVGTALMRDFRRRIAGMPLGSPVFLETESLKNVRFYEQFGFSTIGERMVLGVPTWVMMRRETVGLTEG